MCMLGIASLVAQRSFSPRPAAGISLLPSFPLTPPHPPLPPLIHRPSDHRPQLGEHHPVTKTSPRANCHHALSPLLRKSFEDRLQSSSTVTQLNLKIPQDVNHYPRPHCSPRDEGNRCQVPSQRPSPPLCCQDVSPQHPHLSHIYHCDASGYRCLALLAPGIRPSARSMTSLFISLQQTAVPSSELNSGPLTVSHTGTPPAPPSLPCVRVAPGLVIRRIPDLQIPYTPPLTLSPPSPLSRQ